MKVRKMEDSLEKKKLGKYMKILEYDIVYTFKNYYWAKYWIKYIIKRGSFFQCSLLSILFALFILLFGFCIESTANQILNNLAMHT